MCVNSDARSRRLVAFISRSFRQRRKLGDRSHVLTWLAGASAACDAGSPEYRLADRLWLAVFSGKIKVRA